MQGHKRVGRYLLVLICAAFVPCGVFAPVIGAMLRLRFGEPLPPRTARRGEAFRVRLQVVNERGVCPLQLSKKGSVVQCRLLDDLLQPHKEHQVILDPKKPEIDGSGICDLLVTLVAKDKSNPSFESSANSVQLWFEAKVTAAAPSQSTGKDNTKKDSATALPAMSLDLNVVSPAVDMVKAGAKEMDQPTRQVSPKNCVKTFYTILGQRVACCEGQQLVDDILPGLAHTVWDAGILLARHIEASLSQGLKGLRCIELGAGPGLAGVAAAVAGAHVTLTDLEPAITVIGGVNVAANRASVGSARAGGTLDAVELAWGDTDTRAGRLAGPWDLVLGSDIIFNEELFAPLLTVLLDLTDPTRAAAAAGRGGGGGGGGHAAAAAAGGNGVAATAGGAGRAAGPAAGAAADDGAGRGRRRGGKGGGQAGGRACRVLLCYRERERCARPAPPHCPHPP